MEFFDFHTHRETAEGVTTPRSFGIHPWYASAEKAATYEEFADRHRVDFAFAEIVGECGLDKVSATPFDIQTRLFQWQIFLAAELHKPMVIHCVRAFNEMLEMRRKSTDGIWVVHGFTGNVQQARQLFRAGIWVSYGAALLDERRTKVRDCLRDNPYPFLLETDDCDCGIEAVYRTAAEILGIDINRLSDTIKQNYLALFGQ